MIISKEDYNSLVAKEDYDMMVWENQNFANYLKQVFGATDAQINQIANGWTPDRIL